MLIDSHCHLDAAAFDTDREQVLQRARAAGVEAIVVPAVERANFAAVRHTCQRYPGCLPALGLHPMYLERHRPECLEALCSEIALRRPVAVGEIGLDHFVPGLDAAQQEYYFVEQLKIAREADLPVLLHVRRAHDQVLKQLRRFRVRGGIAHAFNGSRHQAEVYMDLGFMLGFGGAMTYPHARKLRQLAATLPLEAMVLETDAPDMAPVFARGRRNSPEFLPQIAATLAELRDVTADVVAAATTDNTRKVLGLP